MDVPDFLEPISPGILGEVVHHLGVFAVKFQFVLVFFFFAELILNFEITRLLVDFPLRIDLLESLRPTLHYLCARLDQQASSTNTHGDAIARLAQRLQTNLCSGYKAVILAALEEKAVGQVELHGSRDSCGSVSIP